MYIYVLYTTKISPLIISSLWKRILWTLFATLISIDIRYSLSLYCNLTVIFWNISNHVLKSASYKVLLFSKKYMVKSFRSVSLYWTILFLNQSGFFKRLIFPVYLCFVFLNFFLKYFNMTKHWILIRKSN